ncbi:hypothetical protein [Helcococcus kunzii]|uniref:hypothetical protein n=1 Tax=Helcococcus kunzii TaxID=40091 RepID=UPI0024AC8F1B|nr:hypothetical protein [Helcococcus kunzii]
MKKLLLLFFLLILTSCSNNSKEKGSIKNNEKQIYYEDLKYNKDNSNSNFFNLYEYISKNYKLENSKQIDSSGDENAKFVLMVEPEITFNNKYERTNSQGYTNVLFLKYQLMEKNKYDSIISIYLYNNQENPNQYTFDSYNFTPKSKHETSISNILKYKDYIIRITTNYENKNLDIDSDEYYKERLEISVKATKELIQLLKKYNQ